MDDFETQLKSCHFFQQLMAEFTHRETALRVATTQTIAMLATATARQLNAEMLAETLEHMEAQFARQVPNEVRAEMIRFATSLVRNSGTAASPPH